MADRFFAAAIAVLLVALCPATAAAAASINGVVSYAGTDPDTAIQMMADPDCLVLHTEAVHTERIVGDGAGHLGNVFVYVKSGLAGATYSAPGDSHLLDQKGCQYFPHVSGLMVGQDLLIRNSDTTLHNVHAIPKVNREFNQGQPIQGMETKKSFSKPEVMIRFKCDVHPWMSSYMAVLEHPFFAVSGADGSFAIENLPEGDYELEAWHEELGTLSQQVTVGADGVTDVEFDYGAGGS